MKALGNNYYIYEKNKKSCIKLFVAPEESRGISQPLHTPPFLYGNHVPILRLPICVKLTDSESETSFLFWSATGQNNSNVMTGGVFINLYDEKNIVSTREKAKHFFPKSSSGGDYVI